MRLLLFKFNRTQPVFIYLFIFTHFNLSNFYSMGKSFYFFSRKNIFNLQANDVPLERRWVKHALKRLYILRFGKLLTIQYKFDSTYDSFSLAHFSVLIGNYGV